MSWQHKNFPEQGVVGAVPYIVLGLFIILDDLPVGLGALDGLEIGLCQVPVFHIGLYTESDFAAIGVIAMGLLNDVLAGAPLGFWGLLFCLLYLLATGQRAMLQNTKWTSYWTSFGVLMLPVYMTGYLVALMRDDMSIPFFAYVLSAVVTGLLFPLIDWPLRRIYSSSFGQESY